MSLKAARSALNRPVVLEYLILSAIHWREREDALRYCVPLITPSNGVPQHLRVVDVGCGPGLLVPLALELGYQYLGMDASYPHIAYCTEVFARTATSSSSRQVLRRSMSASTRTMSSY